MNTVKLHEELKSIAEQKRLNGKRRQVSNSKRAWSAFEVSSKWQAYLLRERKKLSVELDVLRKQRADVVSRINSEKILLQNELQFDIIQRTIPLKELQVPALREYGKISKCNSEIKISDREPCGSKLEKEIDHSKMPVYKSVPAWLLTDKIRNEISKKSTIQMRVYDFRRQGIAAVYRTTTFDFENVD